MDFRLEVHGKTEADFTDAWLHSMKDARDEHGNPLIYFAILSNNYILTNLLLSKGYADIEQTYIDEGYDARNLLHAAARGGGVEVIQCLLMYGADINKRMPHHLSQSTPLELAIRNYKLNNAEFLLANGADATARKPRNGKTVLHYAAAYACPEIVHMIIPYYNDIDIQDTYGNTALNQPLEWFEDSDVESHNAVVQLLVSSNANVNHTTPFGESPLYRAAGMGSIDTVALLLNLGAHVNNGSGGIFPINAAVSNNRRDVLELLINRGANVRQMIQNKDEFFGCVGNGIAGSRDDLQPYGIIRVLIQHGLRIEDMHDTLFVHDPGVRQVFQDYHNYELFCQFMSDLRMPAHGTSDGVEANQINEGDIPRHIMDSIRRLGL